MLANVKEREKGKCMKWYFQGMGIHVFCNNFKKYFQISQKKYIGLFCLPKIIGRGKGDDTLLGMNTPSKP